MQERGPHRPQGAPIAAVGWRHELTSPSRSASVSSEADMRRVAVRTISISISISIANAFFISIH